MLLAATKSKKRTCVDLCQTVLQKCPHFLPVPNDGEDLVQVGYSAFNCPDSGVYIYRLKGLCHGSPVHFV